VNDFNRFVTAGISAQQAANNIIESLSPKSEVQTALDEIEQIANRLKKHDDLTAHKDDLECVVDKVNKLRELLCGKENDK